jgi:hypothetical protein
MEMQEGLPMDKAVTHVRENDGVLASVERRTLIWLARRLPARVNSDHLTMLALLAMLGAGLAFWSARVWPPGLALVVVALGVDQFVVDFRRLAGESGRQHAVGWIGFRITECLDQDLGCALGPFPRA